MCLDLHLNKEWGWRHETGLSPPVKYFTDGSKVVLLLWIFYGFFCLDYIDSWSLHPYLLCVSYAFVHVCLFVPCGHLLRKGWPLGSRLCCITVSLSLSHWYPGSGVVLDCIDSWSLHPYLLPLFVSFFSFELQFVERMRSSGLKQYLLYWFRWFCCCWFVVDCYSQCEILA